MFDACGCNFRSFSCSAGTFSLSFFHSHVSHGPAAAVEGRGGRAKRGRAHQARGPRPEHQQLQHYLIHGLQSLTSDPPPSFAKWTELHAHSKERQVS